MEIGPVRLFIQIFLLALGGMALSRDLFALVAISYGDRSTDYVVSLVLACSSALQSYKTMRKRQRLIAAGGDPAAVEAQLAQAEAQARAQALAQARSGGIGALCGAALGIVAGYSMRQNLGNTPGWLFGAFVGGVLGFYAALSYRGFRDGIDAGNGADQR